MLFRRSDAMYTICFLFLIHFYAVFMQTQEENMSFSFHLPPFTKPMEMTRNNSFINLRRHCVKIKKKKHRKNVATFLTGASQSSQKKHKLMHVNCELTHIILYVNCKFNYISQLYL